MTISTTPAPKISDEGKAALDAYLNERVGSKEVPAVFFAVTNKDEEIYINCAGDRKFGHPEEGPVNQDTTLQLYSMTKFVTSLAALTLVDQGLMTMEDFDSPDFIDKHVPEISKLPILEGYTDDGKEILVKPKNRITLKHLLTHTSGMGYYFNAPNIARYTNEHKVQSLVAANATIENSLTLPLTFEPGTKWQYSVGIDWAGIVLERVTGKGLDKIFEDNLFGPCGIKDMTFYPTPDIKDRLMALCTRNPETMKVELPTPQGTILKREWDQSKVGPVLSGGGGLFGTTRAYLTLLRNVLASNDPNNSKPLLSQTTFKALFTEALPKGYEAKCREGIVAQLQNGQWLDPELSANGTGKYLGHTLGLMVNLKDSTFGRKAGSGCWGGAAKTQFWIDPTTGIAGVCNTNIQPMPAEPFDIVYREFERKVYDSLVE